MQCKNCGTEMKFYSSNITYEGSCTHTFEVSAAVRVALQNSDNDARTLSSLIQELKETIKEMKRGCGG